MALWLKADGTKETVQPANGKKFSLAELQKYVGGYIELVKTRKPVKVMYINEEGMLKNLPPNRAASELIDPHYLVIDSIRGDAIVMEKGSNA